MFLPWDLSTNFLGLGVSSEHMYALIIMGITTLYVVKGGMYSVVITEVLQFVVMTIACISIGVIAMNLVSAEQINALIPDGWKSLAFGWTLDIEWTRLPDQVNAALNQKIASDGYELFGIFMMIVIFRGILVSIAGPVPGYDMQRVLAAKTPKEAAMMSGFVSLVLFIPRYLMIAGLGTIALVYFNPASLLSGDTLDSSVRFVELYSVGDSRFNIGRTYRRVHVDLRRQCQCGTGLYRQRHLQEIHQSKCLEQ